MARNVVIKLEFPEDQVFTSTENGGEDFMKAFLTILEEAQIYGGVCTMELVDIDWKDGLLGLDVGTVGSDDVRKI